MLLPAHFSSAAADCTPSSWLPLFSGRVKGLTGSCNPLHEHVRQAQCTVVAVNWVLCLQSTLVQLVVVRVCPCVIGYEVVLIALGAWAYCVRRIIELAITASHA